MRELMFHGCTCPECESKHLVVNISHKTVVCLSCARVYSKYEILADRARFHLAPDAPWPNAEENIPEPLPANSAEPTEVPSHEP